MRDADCVAFLRWALPRLGFRWRGFRRVRRQVCRRIERRRRELGLPDVGAYRERLLADPAEWERLAPLCRVTISRFFRDRELFRGLEEEVLPELAARFCPGGKGELWIWSAGCGAGEEPYSLSIVGRQAAALAGVRPRIVGTDVDACQLARARRAVYPESSLRDVSAACRETAFERVGEDAWRLGSTYRRGVGLVAQDLRQAAPAGPFHLTLCRNLAFTYFERPLQRRALDRIRSRLRPAGALVIGGHEELPPGTEGFEPWPGQPCVWQERRTTRRAI